MTEDSAAIFAHLGPYDSSMDENLTMYDRLPYDRDVDLCGPQTIKLETGNVIKYYRCNLDKKSYSIRNRDKEMAKRLKELQSQEVLTESSNGPPEPDVLEMNEELLNGLPGDEDILGSLTGGAPF